jgi:hypothetical protein
MNIPVTEILPPGFPPLGAHPAPHGPPPPTEVELLKMIVAQLEQNNVMIAKGVEYLRQIVILLTPVTPPPVPPAAA